MTGPDIKVSVIIVTYNSTPVLSDCLTALEKAVESVRAELIIVDNASTDGSAEAAQRLCEAATVVTCEKNLGFAAGCNRGVEHASGEYLLFVNPDVVIDPDAIIELIRHTNDREKAGLVSGRLRNSDGSFQATCRRFPSPGNLVFSRGSWLGKATGLSGARYTLPDSGAVTEVEAVAATMIMTPLSTFQAAGGFDSQFFMFMEDTDLSLRMRQMGYSNLFVPSAGGIHGWGKGSDIGMVKRRWRHHVSVWKYFLKHYPNGFSVVILPLLLGINFLMLLITSSVRDRN